MSNTVQFKPRIKTFFGQCLDSQWSKAYTLQNDVFKKEVSEEDFEIYMDYRKRALGEFVEVVSIDSAWESMMNVPNKEIQATLRYTRGETSGRFHFIRYGGKNWGWDLYRVQINIPLAAAREHAAPVLEYQLRKDLSRRPTIRYADGTIVHATPVGNLIPIEIETLHHDALLTHLIVRVKVHSDLGSRDAQADFAYEWSGTNWTMKSIGLR